MDAKSVITSPSPQAPIKHKSGPLVVSGLAWSGHGAITRVDVTLDGGKNWYQARLAKPGETKALTRFYLDIDWNGKEMFLQSRAHDETGYVQPTKEQLRKVRGLNSIYHNNSIATWKVNKDGTVDNVRLG